MKKYLSLTALLVLALFMMVSCATKALSEPVVVEEAKTLDSSVKDIQKYGNLVLSITKSDMDSIGAEYGDVFTVDLGDQVLEAPYCTSYSDVEIGDLVLRNDGDGIILAINMGDFASSYGIATKVSNPDKTYQWVFEEGKKLEDITLSLILTSKGEYRGQYLIHQLFRTNERDDYSSDAVFANFREIVGGNLGSGALFRSSSPVNNEIGRAKYADELVSFNNIRSVMNLADNREAIEGYFKEEDFASPYYKSLYENGQVIALNMGVSFKTREFQNGLVEGLTFLSKNEGPYLVHCNEGKDRAGFTSALLSALMGLTYDEIASDYMTSYENYYHVEKGTEQYEAVKRSNIDSMLSFIAGVETKDLENVDLSVKAEEFLVAIGMEKVDIDTLKSKLSKNYK
ncbi:MAG: tyrosine-protein phosphatase [Spirochaetales bacterium]|nr:tyrosine-protein phosphatase [Spirochaetales bacterium]